MELTHCPTKSVPLPVFCWWIRFPSSDADKSPHGYILSPVGQLPWSVDSSPKLSDWTPSLHCPWRRKWQPTPVFLRGESHRQRSLVGYIQWGRKSAEYAWATEHALLLLPLHLSFQALIRSSLDSSNSFLSAPCFVLPAVSTFIRHN